MVVSLTVYHPPFLGQFWCLATGENQGHDDAQAKEAPDKGGCFNGVVHKGRSMERLGPVVQGPMAIKHPNGTRSAGNRSRYDLVWKRFPARLSSSLWNHPINDSKLFNRDGGRASL